jgi:hypothetical protein
MMIAPSQVFSMSSERFDLAASRCHLRVVLIRAGLQVQAVRPCRVIAPLLRRGASLRDPTARRTCRS